MSLPVGVVTLLFSDIEGSTQLLQTLGDAYGDVLAVHQRLLRAVWLAHDGVEVSTEGDSFFVAFVDPGQAVRAAVAAQLALEGHDWPSGGELRVRVGVHTGSPRVRDADYWGIDVHYAARLCAAAHGGQTLVSESTASLVDVGLDDLGLHALKDFPAARRIFYLPIDGRGPTEFPPLRGVRSGQTNLPDQLSSFVGRSTDLVTVRDLVFGGRLVTLVGAGGVGKTRLAAEVGSRLLDGTGDGVWFVDLASITTPELIASTIAKALRVAERSGEPVLDSIASAVSDREMLVILDNCEHLIESVAASTEALLQRCSGLRILATSREPLRIAGEQVYRVPSLSVPDSDDEDLTLMQRAESVQLFVARARQQRPEFTITDDNATAVGRVCRRLDGIPLAIELAAVRLRSLPITELETRLDQRFQLLNAGTRGALPRQQTLLALIDWSYQLLSDAEQQVLAYLSVFAANGFTLKAAEAVCATQGLEPFEVLDHLDALVDKSLIQADDNANGIRYRLLETIREYAAQKLAAAGSEQVTAAQIAHRDHYLTLAEMLTADFYSPNRRAHLDRLDAELENLRVAERYSLDDPDPEPGLRLVIALARFTRDRGYLRESLQSLNAHLTRPEAAAPSLTRGEALHQATMTASLAGSLGEAVAFATEALRIGRSLGDPGLTARALHELGDVSHNQGDQDAALQALTEALALARELDDPRFTASVLLTRAITLRHRGDDAAPSLAEALDLQRLIGNVTGVASTLSGMGNLAEQNGDLLSARAHLQEALDILREVQIPAGIAVVSSNLARIAHQLGDDASARVLGLDAAHRAYALGLGSQLAYALYALGLGFASIDAKLAANLHGAADQIAVDTGLQLETLEAQARAAAVINLRRQLGETQFQAALSEGQNHPPRDLIARADRAAGELNNRGGTDREAEAASDER